MEFVYKTVTANTQKDRAFKVAAARGWTILADANFGTDATKYGWSFIALNKQGRRVGVIFNARSDWSGNNDFPFETMDEAAFGFKVFADANVEAVFVCETNFEATRCIIARDREFGEEHWRMNTRSGKWLKVRSFANPNGRVVNVNLI